jgi:hypothetical protein
VKRKPPTLWFKFWYFRPSYGCLVLRITTDKGLVSIKRRIKQMSGFYSRRLNRCRLHFQRSNAVWFFQPAQTWRRQGEWKHNSQEPPTHRANYVCGLLMSRY